MESLTLDQVIKLNYASERESYGSDWQNILTALSNGFYEIIQTALRNCDYPEYEFDESTYNSFDDRSILGVVAKGVYEFFEKLAMAKGKDDLIRHHAIGIWIEIFGVATSVPSRNQNEIGKRLLCHIRKKVKQNLDYNQRWYPAITKLLLSLNGISEANSNDVRIVVTFHNEFIDAIKQNYQTLYAKDEKFALNMLPEWISYDHINNKLIEKHIRGLPSELNLS
jgi:hypothetical protein